jgi:hypothetical protein
LFGFADVPAPANPNFPFRGTCAPIPPRCGTGKSELCIPSDGRGVTRAREILLAAVNRAREAGAVSVDSAAPETLVKQ